MPALDLGADYVDGQTATADIFNDKFNAIEALLNVTKLDEDNLQMSAIIAALLADASFAPGIQGEEQPVTSLPGSPVDGQVALVTASATDGIFWRFRYNADSASAYKWEFIGGSPLLDTSSTELDVSLPAYGTVGSLTLTLPALAGDYYVEHSGAARQISGTSFHYATIGVNGTAQTGVTTPPNTSEELESIKLLDVAGTLTRDYFRRGTLTSLAASRVIAVMHKVPSGTVYCGGRSLLVRPIRVSN